MNGEPTSTAPAASVTFLCYDGGRVETDLWARSPTGGRAARNAYAIERIVRVTMNASAAHREAIGAAMDRAEAEEDAP